MKSPSPEQMAESYAANYSDEFKLHAYSIYLAGFHEALKLAGEIAWNAPKGANRIEIWKEIDALAKGMGEK